MAYQETYNRAYIQIISRLLSFPTVRSKDWLSTWERNVKVGDFVSLQCAPASEWQLSWVMDINSATDNYLLKSASTGKLCNWSNVGFSILKDEEALPEFSWTDRQFAFGDKFKRAIKRNYDHWHTFGGIEFDNFKVTCHIRKRHDFSETPFRESITFEDFRKVKTGQLNDFYLNVLDKQEN